MTKASTQHDTENSADLTTAVAPKDEVDADGPATVIEDGEEKFAAAEENSAPEVAKWRRIPWRRTVVLGLIPGLALLMGVAAGLLKWQADSAQEAQAAATESVAAARDSTIALLSYKPDTADQELGAARDRLTGQFRDSYTQLTHDVVIPGAKQKKIAAVASIPAASSVSASAHHAIVLLFVDQTVTVGDSAPTDTASSVRVTLDKIDGRWLISGFDPV